MINFFRGPYDSYNQDVHGEGIYFATDKGIIKMGGKDYIGPLGDSTAVKSIALNEDGTKFIITYLNDDTSEIGVATSKYESNMDENLTTPAAVGGIPKGTKVSDFKDKTFSQMFDDLLFPTVNPTFTAPSASIAFKNYNSIQEVGVDGPTSANFTTGYSAGKIDLNGTKQANRGGLQNTDDSFIYVNGVATNKTLPEKVTLGNTTFKYRAAFEEGPQPKDNKGNNYGSPLAAGTVDSSAITLNGTYPWFATKAGASIDNPFVKMPLIAWNATPGAMYTGNDGFTLEADRYKPGEDLTTIRIAQAIKIPNQRTITNMESYDPSTKTWQPVVWPLVWTSSEETITINGTDVVYTVYTYTGALRGQVKLRIYF